MLVRVAAHHAAALAAFLMLLPGHIGAGEADGTAFPKMRLAALVETPKQTFPQADRRPETSLAAKWHIVRQQMQRERRLVSLCRNDPTICPSDATTLFMAIVDVARPREGRALIGEINRAVNLAVRPVSDQRKHGADIWTSPLATLSAGEGDCEDYAIAKLAALWAAGVPESETRLVIVHDARIQEDHAIAMVRLEGRWLALDNKRFALIEAADLSYQPLFVIGGNVRAFSGEAAWTELDADENLGLSARDYSGASSEAGESAQF